jgi:Uma2 family endonuclease
MATAQSVLISAEDYRLLPETGPRYQLVEGELYMAPAPKRFHQDISLNLEAILLRYLEERPAGRMYHAPFDVYLTEHNVYQPDLLFIANERLHILTEDGVAGAPNFIVEILSEGTGRLDRQTKRKVYAAAGVEELWLADPAARSIEVFLLQQNSERPVAVYHEGDAFNSPAFPGLDFNVTAIFKRDA